MSDPGDTTIDFARYVEEGRRLADEVAGLGWDDMATAEGLDDPARFLQTFASDVMDSMVDSALRGLPPATMGVPTLCALIIGLRIGRMQATRAFEEFSHGG